MKRVFIRIFFVLLAAYGITCTGAYFFQEKLIFLPQTLPGNHTFRFESPFTEMNIKSPTGNKLNGLLFNCDNPKGLVLYFHGNAGSLESWGNRYDDFISQGYRFLIFDYAGYGKSKGELSEENLFTDAQAQYDFAKTLCPENEITVYGRSLGSGIASHLASKNNPCRLLLESPFYSMKDLSGHLYPFLPSFLLRYPLRTDLLFPSIACPVFVLHGTRDEVIYFESSLKLKELFKPEDKLYIINGGHHNDLNSFPEFKNYISKILR